MKQIAIAVCALLTCLAAFGGTGAEVYIEGFAFHPQVIVVNEGDTVLWTNLDSIGHSITSQTGPGTLIPSGLFHSGEIYLGEQFSFTFTQPGVFYYYCQPHGSSMQGTIIVLERLYGDLNCDGRIDNFDIDPFVTALIDSDGYFEAFPNCDAILADVNRDGRVDNFDIGAFVDLLIS